MARVQSAGRAVRKEEALVIRKHTRRAAKAAFAISLGVAIVLGGFAGAARSATHAGPDDHDRHQELPRGVHPRRALQAGAQAKGFTVTYKENIGSTEMIQTALTSGKINFYPEYTGVIVQDVFHHDELAEDGRGDLRAREVARGGQGLHAAERRRRSTTPTCSR